MSSILIIYTALFLIQFVFSLYLDFLNYRHIQAHSNSAPEYLKGAISDQVYKNSVQYSLTKIQFSVFSTVINSSILLALVVSGSFGYLDIWIQQFNFNVYLQAIFYLLIVSLFFLVIGIPFSLYSTFVIEERFGFNKTTFKLWCQDQVKSLILSSILLSLIVSALVWFLQVAGDLWWIYAFIFITGFQLVMIFIYPIWIAPLFNKFTPLDDSELKEKIEKVAKGAGYQAESVFVMDGSKRSQHANAYFTGFGKAKRIVLYDTLINLLSHDQLLAVLAHEIGHEKLNHIKKSMALSFVIMFFTFYLIDLLMTSLPFFEAFGFNRVCYHGAFVIFSFASAPVSFWLAPLFSFLSRKHEYEADSFAVNTMHSKEGLMTALIQLSQKSLSNFTPHPLYSFFHYSHPTLHERLNAMEALHVAH